MIGYIVANAESKNPHCPQLLKLDLEFLESVCKAAEEFKQRSNKLNILITNADVMLTPFSQTKDGFERQYGTNHLAHFYLFQLLKPLVLESAAASSTASRVVTVSSAGYHIS